jgi:hypothetical protein
MMMCDTIQWKTVFVVDTAMKPSSGPRLRPHLPALLLCLACSTPVLADPLSIAGRWLADEPAGPDVPYTSLTIKDDTMTWRGPDKSVPACVRRFAVQTERPGTVYTNARGTKFVAGAKGSIPTYLLQLDGGACGTAGSTLRINFPLIYDTQHIELIDYAAGKPVNARRFHRKK